MPYDTPQSTSGDLNLEALISEAGQTAPIQDAPDSSGAVTEPAAAAPTTTTVTPQSAPAKTTYPEVEFTWNGKPVKAPWDKARQWAQQGYDYSQRIQAFNKQQKDWEAQREAQKKEYEQKYNPYIEVDELAKQHPEQWQFIQQQLQKLQNPHAFAETQSPDVQALINEKLAPIQKFITSFEQHQSETVQKSHDDNLTQEIQSIREKHSNLDWETYDENGMNLEKRVIDHALKNGISNFRAAFRDYNFDHLTKYEADRAKEAMAKETQKRSKLGLLGQSPTPKANAQSDRKPKNYNEAASMAMEELGIA